MTLSTTNKLEKATENDKRQILSKEVSDKFSVKDEYDGYCRHHAWLDDYDDQFVYWSIFAGGDFNYFKTAYTFNGTAASLSDEKVEVVRMTEYEEVSDSDIEKAKEDRLVTKVVNALSKHFGGSTKKITKAYDEDMITVEPLYIGAFEVDGVGDAYYNSDECFDMVDNLNKAIENGILQGNYFHKAFTDDFEPIEAFCNKAETTIEGTDVIIPANQPVVVLKYNNQETFDLRKSGDLMGPSIGARASEIIDVDTGKVISKNADIILGSDAMEDDAVVKRLLKGINFDFDSCHVALTEKSQGGACSLKNDFYLAKANKKKKLTKEQKELLEKMGHDISEIEKSMDEITKSSASDSEVSGVNQNINNKDDENMSEKLENEIAQLRKELSEAKVKEALSGYGLDKEVEKELVSTLATVKDACHVYKALDAVVAAGEAKAEKELEKAKEQHEEALGKAKEASDNPLEKELEKETGEGAKTGSDKEVEKSRTERVGKYLPKAKESE